MKKIFFQLTSLYALLFLFAACGGAPKAGPKANTAPSYSESVAIFYPLAVGYKWTFKGTMIGIVTERTVQITGQEDGYYLDNSGGAFKIDAYGLLDKSGRYLLRGPLAKGTTWMSVPNVSTVERYEIVSEGKEVSTPAGLFRGCLEVKSTSKLNNGDMLINITTFAPKVGIIKIQTFVQSKTSRLPQVDLSLINYSTY
jgi:hypothetical protein